MSVPLVLLGEARMSEETRCGLVYTMGLWQQANLELNADKGDNWRACDLGWLCQRLENEVKELFAVATSENVGLVWSEAADVANMAAMIADCADARAAGGGGDE